MGRKPGVPNKVTADVKAMILQALSDAGGADYLRARSQDEPAAFMQLVGKVLPMQVTGADGAPLIPPDTRPPPQVYLAALLAPGES